MVSLALNYKDINSFFVKKRFKIKLKTAAMIAATVLSLAIALIVYMHQRNRNDISASNAYMQVLHAIKQNDMNTATNYCLLLTKDYENSPYARLAGLFLAKIAFEEKNIDLARERLTWVVEHSKQDNLIKPVAIARLARLEINNKEYARAIEIIDKYQAGKDFSVMLEEVRGDALLLQGDRDGAIKSYQIVAKNLSGKMDLGWLYEKLNDLGVEKNVIEIKDPKDN